MNGEGLGYEQVQARRLARELGGIATEVRWSASRGTWVGGVWPAQEGNRWIVVDYERRLVLADGSDVVRPVRERLGAV